MNLNFEVGWKRVLLALAIAIVFLAFLGFAVVSCSAKKGAKLDDEIQNNSAEASGLPENDAEPEVEEPVVEETRPDVEDTQPESAETNDDEMVAAEVEEAEEISVEEVAEVVAQPLEKTELLEIAQGEGVFPDLKNSEVPLQETVINDGEGFAGSLDWKSKVYVDNQPLDLEYDLGKVVGIYNATGAPLTIGVETTLNEFKEPNEWNVWPVVFSGSPEQFSYRIGIWQQGEQKPVYVTYLYGEGGVIEEITVDPETVVQEKQEIEEGFVNLLQDADVFSNINDKNNPILEREVEPGHALSLDLGLVGKVFADGEEVTADIADAPQKLVTIYNDSPENVKVNVMTDWNQGSERWNVHPVYYLAESVEKLLEEMKDWHQDEPEEIFLFLVFDSEGMTNLTPE